MKFIINKTLNINKNYIAIRNIFLLLSLLPIIFLALDYIQTGLKPNPYEALSHTLGHTALIILMFAFAITPLRRWLTFAFTFIRIPWGRRLADWNFLIRLRRPIGIVSFLYAFFHMAVYLYLELDLDISEFQYELVNREFILVGFFALILSFVLAITSSNSIRKRMGNLWLKLHRLMYLLVILAIAHYWMFAKATDYFPKIYALFAMLLFAHRVIVLWYKPLARKDDTGNEVFR